MVMYCSGMMNKYYSCLGFLSIKHNEDGKEIINEIFNNTIFHHKIFMSTVFNMVFMYNDRLIILKRKIILPIPDSMIPLYLCQMNKPKINFTTNDMTFKFEAFSKKNGCTISN